MILISIAVLEDEYGTKLAYFLSFDGGNLEVEFAESVSYYRLISIVNALDWICKAIRCPPPQDLERAVYLSTSAWHILNATQNTGPARDDQNASPRIVISFSIRTKPNHSIEDSCWQKLFKSAFVVVDEGPQGLEPVGHGLEMSFDLMTRLAAIEYPVEVDGGVILAGYQTVLFPTRLESTYAQFHLEISDNGQINPFDLEYKSRLKINDYARIKNMRCFLGWCDLAHIQLGSRSLPMSVMYSDAKKKGKTLQRSGISTGFQFTSASPVQAGINGQMSYSFVSHRLRFQPSSDYIKMLFDTSKDVALVSDVQARRSWLVPKLSLMLHMAHAWVNIMSPSPKDDPIPFVEPHEDGRDVVKALEDHGDIVICGQNTESFTLRRLLMGLSLNLLASVDRKARSTKRILYGFEFMDLVSEPGRGGFMKELKIGASPSWLALANLADAVIVCSKLGEAIIPAHDEHRKKRTCDIVPCGQDFLAVHLTCIGGLMDRAGMDKNTFDDLISIPLSHEINWTVSGNPFENCNHERDGADTCWARQTMLQSLGRDRVFRFKRSSHDQNSNSRSKSRDMKGAVVFGKHRAKADKVL
ncbi:uncharacterized protein N0V89_012619 [Didymosphaeria variabile]|uniref:Uncharacterized protein n=1 Tax=Didymosphaeria variabile TaxID=1932322 RepID=A0A9W8XAZ9_9PLEO|nr:uncharacterized protein N0V89_012619 [Didymosphaeria variabile]KAJ4344875.1 hypothetical protein N0V89_012619 [Didymosphaeria variabile]